MPTFITWFIAVMVAGFSKGIFEGVLRLLFQLGIGFTIYQGIDLAIDAIASQVVANFASMPLAFTQLMGLLQVDKALNVIISAYGVRMVIKGVTSGSLTKIGVR